MLDMVVDRRHLKATLAEALRFSDGRLPHPATFFELTTAVAFEVFRDAAVDVTVLEVGLGGRLDATNVAAPIAAAVVSIDFDHMAHLGPTLERIAFEKAGIIKPGLPVVVGPMADGPRATIGRVAADRRATTRDAYAGITCEAAFDRGKTTLRLATAAADYGQVRLALRGRHQVDNAVVAVGLLETLDRVGVRVGREAIVTGLETAIWPGRLHEVTLADRRWLLLDAAHNPAGARALAAYVAEAHGALPLVFGAMRDKAIEPMLEALAPVTRHAVFTGLPLGRAQDPVALARAAAAATPWLRVSIEPDPVAAVRRALVDAPAPWSRDRCSSSGTCSIDIPTGTRRGGRADAGRCRADADHRGRRPRLPVWSRRDTLAGIPGRFLVSRRRPAVDRMMRSLLSCLVVGLVWAVGAPALAQSPIPGLNTSKQFTIERLGENHWKLTGEVELEKDDMRFFADEVEYFADSEIVLARGNVVYASRDNRIAADRMEFNTKTRTGVFYEASGTASLGERVERASSARRSPTPTSTATPSRRSARRSTGSPGAASRRACSRRRAGRCRRARWSSRSKSTPSSGTRC
jgi:folylpolyglutamate synthase/dihydrofolate synthase